MIKMKRVNRLASVVFFVMVYMLVTDKHIEMGWGWIFVAIPPALLLIDFLRKRSRKLDVVMGLLWTLVLGGWSVLGILSDTGASTMTFGVPPTSDFIVDILVLTTAALFLLAGSNFIYAIARLIDGDGRSYDHKSNAAVK